MDYPSLPTHSLVHNYLLKKVVVGGVKFQVVGGVKFQVIGGTMFWYLFVVAAG